MGSYSFIINKLGTQESLDILNAFTRVLVLLLLLLLLQLLLLLLLQADWLTDVGAAAAATA